MESVAGYGSSVEMWSDPCGQVPSLLSTHRPQTLGKPPLTGPGTSTVATHQRTAALVSPGSLGLSAVGRLRKPGEGGLRVSGMSSHGGMVVDETLTGVGGDQKHPSNRILRPHSTPATLIWLEENYEVAEGVCIPRSTLYMHYVDFCTKNSMQPVNAASFGKIIRQQFPQLTTRRLGTRGQSRYHYYGIAVRESSPYFQLSFSKKGATSYDSRREMVKQVSLYSPRSRAGAVLPEFPTVKELNLPPTVDAEKITTFLMMYRTHCQRVLDTVIRDSFNEVQNFLLHFWQGMPPHLSSILDTSALVNLVGICDSILYKAISNILLPSVLQTLPDSLTKVIRKFIQELDYWLRMAMSNLPGNLRLVKLEMARQFAQVLRRQMSLNHLAQASRMVVHNSDITSQMLHDWRQIDVKAICRETLYSMEQNQSGATYELVLKLTKDFESLLEEEVPIDTYVEWVESLVNKCVRLPSMRKRVSVRRLARQFLLMWSAFGTRVIRDMTLHSAASFGSFHLLRLMFDDYVLYLVETIHADDQIKEFMKHIVTDTPPQFSESPVGEYTLPFGMESEHPAYGVAPVQDQYVCDAEEMAASPPAQEVPPSSVTPRNCSMETAPPLEDEEQISGGYSCSPGEYYQSFYQGGNYDVRRSWSHATMIPRADNKAYTCQQPAQYVIVKQDDSTARMSDNTSQCDTCRPNTAGQGNGFDYSQYNSGRPPEDNNFHADPSTTSIMYTASGAIYQNYTVLASPCNNEVQEKVVDASQCRQKPPEKSRIYHHVTLRMDGTVYCDG